MSEIMMEEYPALADSPRLRRLVGAIVAFQEESSLDELRELLAQGEDPHRLLTCFMEAMRQIGQRFEDGSYYIAALIMAGEIMRQATEILIPHLVGQSSDRHGGRVLIGTIQGDIHDLGKNLFAMLLRCNNFEVIDLGVDVPAQTFLREVRTHQPDVVAISCVLTTSVPMLKEALELLGGEGSAAPAPVIIGGTCLDRVLAEHLDAKHWAPDAAAGLRLCRELARERG